MKNRIIIFLVLVLLLTSCKKETRSRNSETMDDGFSRVEAEDEEGQERLSLIESDNNDLIPSGQDEMKLEDIIKKYKEIFNIGQNYDEFGTDVYSEGKEKSYDFNYFDTQTSNSLWFSTDNYGNLISFGQYMQNPSKEKEKLFTRKQAVDKARSILDKLYGSQIANDFKLSNRNSSLSFNESIISLTFIRSVNGILVPSDYIDIDMRKDDLEIVNLYVTTETNRNFSDISYFDNTKELVNKEEAYKKFQEVNKLYKSFMPIVTNTSRSLYQHFNYRGVYSLYGQPIPVDAKNLEANYQVTRGFINSFDAVEKASEELTPVEEVYLEDISNQKTSEEAEKRARELFNLGNDYKLNWSNFANYNSMTGIYLWDMSFNNNDDQYVNVSLLANDLTLMGYSKSFDNEGKVSSQDLSQEEIIKLAENFISNKANLKLDELELSERSRSEEFSKDKTLTFVRKISDDEYILKDYVRISFQPNSKEIYSFNRKWDFKFEKPDFGKEISSEKAFELLDQVYDFGLVYRRIKSKEKPYEVRVFYEYLGDDGFAGDEYIVDPEREIVINSSGEQVRFDFIKDYEDIDQVKNPGIIRELADNDIGFFNGLLEPKKPIKIIEFFRILLRANYSLNSISNLTDQEILNYIKEEGILDKNSEIDIYSDLSQRNLAKFLIRLKKLDGVAKRNQIFKDLYNDINSSDPDFGYLILAKEYNFIDTYDKTRLEPEKIIDRETALYSYYNYITNK